MEQWETIKGYENYQISTLGNVKNIISGSLLKPQNNGKGYQHVCLYDKNHKGKLIMVHRLVAQTFIPNPNNLPQVNHKDENKKNNCVDNLEWCDSNYNINYGTHNERIGLNNPRRRKIYSIDSNGNTIHYDSIRAAVKYWKEKGVILNPSGITHVLKGENYLYKKLAWFDEMNINGIKEYKQIFESHENQKRRKVYCVFQDNTEKHFDSILSGAKFFGMSDGKGTQGIRRSIQSGERFVGAYWYCENVGESA